MLEFIKEFHVGKYEDKDIYDYYKLFGINPSDIQAENVASIAAFAEKLKLSYRKLALQYHPDKPLSKGLFLLNSSL